jgi:ribosomal protein S25
MDAKLVEEIAKLRPPTPPRPDGFGVTVDEYAEAQGIGRGVAVRVLGELQKAGVLTVQIMLQNGRAARVYSKPKTKI